jgi:hypothetical protein
MKSFTSIPRRPRTLAITALLIGVAFLGTVSSQAATAPALLDDCSDPRQTSGGVDRVVANDKELGSQSQATTTCENGVLFVRGELVPGRGVPAFISLVLPLSADFQPHDATAFAGIRIRIKVTKGTITVQAASSAIENFDFHTSGPIAAKRGELQEVRLPFGEMKRGWSEQTPLKLESITSVNLVAFGTARDTFAYEVDEIGFY